MKGGGEVRGSSSLEMISEMKPASQPSVQLWFLAPTLTSYLQRAGMRKTGRPAGMYRDKERGK